MAKNLKRILIAFIALQVPSVFANEIIVGPYLQIKDTHSILVKWQTEQPSPSLMEYTNDNENFYMFKDKVLKTRHEALITNPKPSTKYEYSIFNKKEGKFEILKNDIDKDRFNFISPDPSSDEVIAWVLGDPGVLGDPELGKRIHKSQIKVKEAFSKHLKINKINNLDFIIALGDNAYSHGTNEEYRNGFFTPYADVLSSYPVYSAFGNHDGGIDKRNLTYSARSYPRAHGIYYDLFSFPGKESYYSFDRGEAHFVFLDSFDSLWEDFNGSNYEKVWTDKSNVQNSMIEWLKADLASTNKTWTIVCFHHPPFGQTEHTDEKTQDLWKAWTNAYITPILQENNVDLVLMGHIHNYQRSYPVKLERHDVDRSSLKPKSKIKEDRIHFVKKYVALLDKLQLPRYEPIATNKEKKHYSKKDDPIYVIMGSSGAAFRDLPDEHDETFFRRKRIAGSTLLKVTPDQIKLEFISEEGEMLDEFDIVR